MKIFEIIDETENSSVGTLLYYEKVHSFIIELVETLDEWNAPLLFSSLVKKGIYTIPGDICKMWVNERIIPSGRQNIDSILQTHKLKEYNEMTFLELSHGKCSQDSLYIKSLSELPYYVRQRQQKNLSECVMLKQKKMLCFFRDKSVRIIDLESFKSISGIDKVSANETLYNSGMVGVGGYSITFNNAIEISACELYKSGILLPLSSDDFEQFVMTDVLDSSECCTILNCSRQNLKYLCDNKKIKTVKNSSAGNLYLKGAVLKNTWD